MTAHDWFVEHRTEYAARVLDDSDAARFAEHLPTCDACRAAIARVESDLEWLPMAVSPVPASPELQRRILQHATAKSGGGLRRWSLPIGIAASIVSGLVGWQLGAARTAPERVIPVASVAPDTSGAAQLLALRDTLSVMRQAARVMQAKITTQGREGGLVVFADPVTHRWNVVVHGLPQAAPNQRYQFWFVCADGMVRGAEVDVDPRKPMMFTTGMPAPGKGEVLGAALTIEPMDAADGPSTGPMLAKVML